MARQRTPVMGFDVLRRLGAGLKPVGLFMLAVVLAVGVGAAAANNGAIAITVAVLFGLAAWVTITILCPVNALVTLWAFLLPIWSVGSLDPLVFDVARMALALSVVVKTRSSGNKVVTRIALAIGITGAFLVLVGLSRGDAPAVTLGYTMTIASVAAWMVLSRVTDRRVIYRGYLAGVTLSAVVLIMSAAGWSVLTPLDDPGFSRLTGLSPSATLVTYELAVGVLVGICMFGRGRRVWFAFATIACLVALLLSGGRGGVLALALALAVALRWGWVRIIPGLLLTGAAYVPLSIMSGSGFTFNTLTRLFAPSDVLSFDPKESRQYLLDISIQAALREPIAGLGMEQFYSMYLRLPHIALLTFQIAGGILPALIIFVIFMAMLRKMLFRGPQEPGGMARLGHLLLAVMTVQILLEANGPFVGTEGVALLMLALSSVAPTTPQPPADPHVETSPEGDGAALRLRTHRDPLVVSDGHF